MSANRQLKRSTQKEAGLITGRRRNPRMKWLRQRGNRQVASGSFKAYSNKDLRPVEQDQDQDPITQGLDQ